MRLLYHVARTLLIELSSNQRECVASVLFIKCSNVGILSFVPQNHASLMNNILQQWNLRNWCTKAHRQVIHINEYYNEPISMLCHSTLIYINEWKSLLAKLKVLFSPISLGWQLTNDEVGLCFCYTHYIKLHMSWVISISFHSIRNIYFGLHSTERALIIEEV